MKNKMTKLAATLLFALTTSVSAMAGTTYNHDIAPDSPAGEGTDALGVNDPAPGWSPGSFQAPGAYAKYYFTGDGLFGYDVEIGDLARVSYLTKKDTTHTAEAPDWFFQMYTQPYDGSPGSSWYGNRLASEPYLSENLTETAGEWTQWDSDGPNNKLRFFDSSSGYFGGYSDGFLADLTADVDYQDQEVMLFAVGLGTAWAGDFDGQIDGLRIELTNGDVANVNFVAIPEPASFSMLGLGGLALLRRRKLTK